jgi:hypothetical protein
MKTFKITEKIKVDCESQKTRSGFRHLATLFIDGRKNTIAKCCYLNRTWERYEFQSVLSKVIGKTLLSDIDRKLCEEFIKGDHTDWSDMHTTGTIAMLGDIFGTNKKEKNDWKARMLKAGLGNSGLIMPDDWEDLDENTKEERLNQVIKLSIKSKGD